MILYTAAHGGFTEAVPLGGGAAVCRHLTEEWTRTKVDFRLITPLILGAGAPQGRDLVQFGERQYARFSREFEAAATEEILRHDPSKTVVLSNDVSEGPDFRRLAEHGFRVYTIYHVDVVAYVAAIYLHGWIAPEITVRWYARWKRLLPDMAKLVWEKQEASVRHSRGLIVPSAGMRDVLLRCYPFCEPSKILVLPWGAWEVADSSDADPAKLRKEFGVPTEARVLLTLSRISPEKGQDLLIQALLDWEKRADFPAFPLWVFVCGEAAFMQGERFLSKLKTLASRLRKTKVVFPGHVTGARKRSFFALADLYVFPSRHESYGLTLLEALGAGLPAVCVDHVGARSVMRPEFGQLISPPELQAAIARLLANDGLRARMGEAAREFARNQRFSDRAAELADRLVSSSLSKAFL